MLVQAFGRHCHWQGSRLGSRPESVIPAKLTVGLAVPLAHHDPTRFFKNPALDRVPQPKDDPCGTVECGHYVGGWLRNLGLGQYDALFRASEIDADILPDLMEVDLEKLGVPLGQRKRLLR